MYNGMTSLSDTTHNGVYVGTDGIALGKGVFKVTNTGDLIANSLSSNSANITGGTINISRNDGMSTGTNLFTRVLTITNSYDNGQTYVNAGGIRLYAPNSQGLELQLLYGGLSCAAWNSAHTAGTN